MENATVRDSTRALLRELGLTTVFGNPGTTEIGFLSEWPADFRYVLALQESVAVAMADGYARAARRPSLVLLHSAGGVGHALGHVFTAYRNRTPMIVLAGQQVRSLLPDEPFLGATDPTMFPRPYVKWSYEPARAQDVPAAVARAYQIAMQAPQGPTFLSVPADDWDAEAARPVQARAVTPEFAPDPEAVRALAAALDASERPAIVVGPDIDADDAVTELVALAEQVRAGVWVSPMSARCSFPEDHPLFLGFLQPERGATAHALSGHDLAIVIGGAAFTYHVHRGEPGTALPSLFLVNDDEQVLARAERGNGIRASPKLAIRALTELTGPGERKPPEPAPRPPAPPATTPITAAYLFSALAGVLPKDAIVVEETPSHRNALHEYLPITSTDTGFLTVASGALGYGLPATVGAAMARPERTVVGVIGDGSSMYAFQALWTAAREDVPVVIVILDNAEYAAVRVLGETAGGRKMPGVDLGGIDFAALARALGCASEHVERAERLPAALEGALRNDRPTLVHVSIDPGSDRIY